MKRKKVISGWKSSFYLGAILIAAHFPGCAPIKIVYKEAKPKPELYSLYNSQRITNEIGRLEKLLQDTALAKPDSLDSTIFSEDYQTDPTFTHEKILEKLFELYIHKSNSKPDYRKAYSHAEQLYKMNTKRKLYYLNWGRILHSYFLLIEERDSLSQEARDASLLSENNKSLKNTLWKQSKHIDSLSVMIKEQEGTIKHQLETIKKLERLDMMMEKQRNKIE